jgi:hypothetical protein
MPILSLQPDETTEKTEPVPDEQLNRAIDVIKGVKLFTKQMKTAKQDFKAESTTAAATTP